MYKLTNKLYYIVGILYSCPSVLLDLPVTINESQDYYSSFYRTIRLISRKTTTDYNY